MRALALLDQLDGNVRTTNVFEQVGQPRHSWLRDIPWLIGAEHLEEAPHLAHRLACGPPYRGQVLPRPLRFALEELLRGPGLHRDDRDAVGNDVVELPGDPCPLL